MKTKKPSKHTLAIWNDIQIANGNFNVRAKRLIEQIDGACRCAGYNSIFTEPNFGGFDNDYQTEIYLTHGQVIEIMRLNLMIKDIKLMFIENKGRK